MLSQGQRIQVENAVNQLYNNKRVRLWVVYVDSFGQDPVGWARTTMQLSSFGDQDARCSPSPPRNGRTRSKCRQKS